MAEELLGLQTACDASPAGSEGRLWEGGPARAFPQGPGGVSVVTTGDTSGRVPPPVGRAVQARLAAGGGAQSKYQVVDVRKSGR